MARVISFINYKGGVGKTTTAYHVGCWLAMQHKKRVLLVDVDPQTNLTFLCAIQERWQSFKDSCGTLASLYEAHLNGKVFDLKSVIWGSPIERAGTPVVPTLDLLPSDVALMGIDLDLMARQPQGSDFEEVARYYARQRTILATALSEVARDYDYVLIDCPPNLYLVTQNALAVSEAYVVTTLPDHLSSVGLSILYQRIGYLNKRLMQATDIAGMEPLSGPQLGGIIYVRVRIGGTAITNMHARKMSDINLDYPGAAFETYTTEGVGYGEAAEQALPVYLMYTPNAVRVARQYKDIADEFLERFPV